MRSLVGREELIHENMPRRGPDPEDKSPGDRQRPGVQGTTRDFVAYLYGRLQRNGYLMRDVQAAGEPGTANSFAAAMVATGHADGMVTGVTRKLTTKRLEEGHARDRPRARRRVIGMSIVLAKGHTLFIADTNITEMPEAGRTGWKIAIEIRPSRAPPGLQAPRGLHVLFDLR